MQFIVTGYDGKDEGALERRLAAREAHLKLVEEMVQKGKYLFATAILDDSEKMIGSVMIVDFSSRAELDEWLKTEPYVIGKVWDEIDVKPCKVPPTFMGLHK
jgi:uncharacterized protein YciI